MFLRFTKLSQFWPEWLGLTGLALLTGTLMRHIGFHLLLDWRSFAFLGLALSACLLLRALRWRPGGIIAEYLALIFVAVPLFGVFTNVCMAMSGPWADAPLLAIDRALGFNWLAGFHFVAAHPQLEHGLRLIYFCVFFEAVYFSVLFGLMQDTGRLSETFRVLFVSLLLTGVGAMAFPALGPFKIFGLESYGGFLPAMEQLHARRDLTFALSGLWGVVGFPSFHTTMALAFAYGFRRTGVIGYLVAAFNGAVLLSVPFVGGHYLADMIGGAAVLLASIAIVRLPAWLRQRAGEFAVLKGEPDRSAA